MQAVLEDISAATLFVLRQTIKIEYIDEEA